MGSLYLAAVFLFISMNISNFYIRRSEAVSIIYDDHRSLLERLRNNGNQDTAAGGNNEVDAASPSFLRQLYDSIQSHRPVGDERFNLLANARQNISGAGNETYISFLLSDDEFAVRKQYRLVMAVKETSDDYYPLGHESSQNDTQEAEEQLSLSIDACNADKIEPHARQQGLMITLGKYVVFNVTDIILGTTAKNDTVLTLKVAMQFGVHILNTNNYIDTESECNAPLLVAFDEFEFSNFRQFFLQSSAVRNGTNATRQRPNNTTQGHGYGNVRHERSAPSTCQLHDWYVHFSDVRLDELIYAPVGYQANFCVGSCRLTASSHRLSNSTSATSNHAILRSFYCHQMRQSESEEGTDVEMPPHPSCVPTEMEPLTMLYRDRVTSYFVLESVPNMIVTECGCR